MGKKSKKVRKSKPNSFAANANACVAKENEWHECNAKESERQSNDEYLLTKMSKIGHLPLQEQKNACRKALIAMGTDCDANDRDPTGDGDQSMIPTEAKRHAAREIYSFGMTCMYRHLADNALSDFAFSCAADADVHFPDYAGAV